MAHAPTHLHDLAAARLLGFPMRDTAGRAPWQSSAPPKGYRPALRLTQRRKTLKARHARATVSTACRSSTDVTTSANSRPCHQHPRLEGLDQWRNFEPWLAALQEALCDALVRYRDS